MWAGWLAGGPRPPSGRAWAARARADAFLYAFDVLEIDGEDLRRDAMASTRRATLASAAKAGTRSTGSGRVSTWTAADGEGVFNARLPASGLEGIVAKRRDRPYRSGRSPDWIKVKNSDAPAATRLIEG